METAETAWEEIKPQELETEKQELEAERAETGPRALTDKMLGLMERISEYGYLTMAEVQFVFGNKTWAYKVMNGLRGQGLVADFDTLMSPRTGHYLTLRGYRVLGKFGRLKTGWRFRPERYSTFSFRHRMACAKVGLALEKHPLVFDFLPEIRLWKYPAKVDEKVCDGEFWYRVPGRKLADRVGLEVELTLKNRDKLSASFKQLGDRELHQVWWICGDKTVLKAMRREALDRAWLAPQQHYFILLDEFLAAKGKAELMEPGGAMFSIDPDKTTLLTREPEPPEVEPPSPLAVVPPSHQPVNQAGAPMEVAPAPAPTPEVELVFLERVRARLASVMLPILRAYWNWLEESWTLHEHYDGSRTLEFHRWPHVGAVAALAVGLIVYPHGAAWFKAADFNLVPPPQATIWRKYRLRDYAIPHDGWTVYPLALRSSNRRYRFKLRLEREGRGDGAVCGLSIKDIHERTLASRTWTRIFLEPGTQLAPDPEFDFGAPRSMDRFFVVLAGCGGPWEDETFLVQFERN